MPDWDNWDSSIRKLAISIKLLYKIVVPIFGAAYAAPNKGTTILYWFQSLSTVPSPTENSRIQGLFKAFEWFSSTFEGKFNFQGLFKKAF